VKIYSDIENIKFKNPIITVGSFDGVHLGHQKLLSKLKDEANFNNGESVVFTFSNHPRKVLNPDFKISLLQTNQEKIDILEKIGIDNLILFTFTKEFSQLTACQFIEKILVAKLNIHKLIVGFNHHFGKDRLSDFEKLNICAKQYNFECLKVEEKQLDKNEISSSKIRQLIENGDVELANKLLDYQYFLLGNIIKGKMLGRKIDFPTANLEFSNNKIIPKIGVYAVKITIDNNQYFGMLNIGLRPTIIENQKDISIETHIFDFNQDIYGKTIKLSFVKRIRDEKKFENLEQLKHQLNKDKIEIKSLFNL